MRRSLNVGVGNRDAHLRRGRGLLSSPRAHILSNVGRFAPRYSDEQKTAIVAAILDDEFPAQDAVDRASAGELGLPPFDMPISTARGYVTRARQKRTREELVQLERKQPGAARTIADRAYEVLEKELDAIIEAQSKEEGVDYTGEAALAVRRIARATLEVSKLTAGISRSTTSRERDATEEPKRSTLVQELLDEAQQGTGNGDGHAGANGDS